MCCLVLQGVFQHLGYLLALASQTCQIWKISRGPLLGFLRGLFPSKLLAFHCLNSSGVSAIVANNFWWVYLTFSEEVPKCFEELEVFSRTTWYWGSVSIYWRSPYRHRIVSSFCSLFLEIIRNSWTDWLATRNNVPGSLVLDFWFIVSLQRRSHGILFLVLLRAYYNFRLYSDYVRKERLI